MSENSRDSEEAYRQLQRRADQICGLVIATDYPAIDVVIQIRKLKEYAEEEFPGKGGLFQRIYESRFRRLWEQFRADEAGALPEWD
jgi:hypothetical protein